VPSELPGPHFQGDVRDLIDEPWDMVIAFPPCQHLARSGARYWTEKQRLGQQQEAIEFFLIFNGLEHVHRIAIENPIGIMSTIFRRPDQVIQPWMFGHPDSKTTCLWLKGLPLLQPTNILELPESGRWENQTPSGQNKLPPSEDRARIRSRTYQGIAHAMAEQWGNQP